MSGNSDGSIIMGMIWMFIISLLLIWLPGLGPLIAGIVGGKTAGGVLSGLMAAMLPGLLLAGGLFLIGKSTLEIHRRIEDAGHDAPPHVRIDSFKFDSIPVDRLQVFQRHYESFIVYSRTTNRRR